MVSDGPVQNSYFEELLEIDGNKLFKLFDEINNDLTNLGFGFFLRFDSTKSDLVTVNDIPIGWKGSRLIGTEIIELLIVWEGASSEDTPSKNLLL